MIDGGGPAFPLPDERGPNGEGLREGHPGMSLRDYFAAVALPTVLAVGKGQVREADLTRLFGKDRSNIAGHEVAAALAYEIADAMLARRR